MTDESANTWAAKGPDDALYYGVSFDRECIRFRLPSIDVDVGTRVRPQKSTGYEYEAVSAGYTQYRDPVWPQSLDATVLDGSVTWITRAISSQSLVKTINGIPVWSAASPIVVMGEQLEGLIASAILSGGNDGEDYPVSVTATFSDGTSLTVPCVLPVRRPTRLVIA